MNWSTILYVVFVSFWVILIFKDVPKNIAINSTHKRYRWLRKFFWGHVLHRFRGETFRDTDFSNTKLYKNEYKLRSYFMDYLRKSVAAKEYYLTHGYDALKATLIGKVEEIEKFLDKYKYNTFDNLSEMEKDFIENFEKKKK